MTTEEKLDAIMVMITKHLAPVARRTDKVFDAIARESIDSRRPEFVIDMRDRIVDVLENVHESATLLDKAEAIIEVFCTNYGGGQLYMPQDVFAPIKATHWQIYSEFNGANYQDLVRKYRYSEVHIRAIVNDCRRAYVNKLQPTLPFEGGQNGTDAN